MNKKRKTLLLPLVFACAAIGVTLLILSGAFVFYAAGSCHDMGGIFRFDWFDCELSGDSFDFVKIVLNAKGYITGALISLVVGIAVFFISKRKLFDT